MSDLLFLIEAMVSDQTSTCYAGSTANLHCPGWRDTSCLLCANFLIIFSMPRSTVMNIVSDLNLLLVNNRILPFFSTCVVSMVSFCQTFLAGTLLNFYHVLFFVFLEGPNKVLAISKCSLHRYAFCSLCLSSGQASLYRLVSFFFLV